MLEAIANPFKSEEIVTVRGPEGATIAELLEAAGIRWRRYGGGVCWIEDEARLREPVAVPRALWHRVRPRAGTVTTVKLMPGRGGGKSILATILSLAVAAAAFFVAPLIAGAIGFTASSPFFGAAVGAIAAGINVIGNLVVGALIPPPQPRTPAEVAASLNDREGFTIQGTANRARPYQKIPLHLGRLKVWPDLAAEHVTEPRGNDVFYRFLMIVGWGPLKMEDWQLGETPVAGLEGFRMNVREGWPDDPPPAIYTSDVHTDGLAIQLENSAGWQTRETQPGTDEIQIEWAFPEGLGAIGLYPGPADPNAREVLVSVTRAFTVEIAPSGTENWVPAPWFNAGDSGFGTPGVATLSDATRTSRPHRLGRIIPDAAMVAANPGKQWRVRILAQGNTSQSTNTFNKAFWSALKSVKFTTPMPLLGKVAWVEGEIKATGQLQGPLAELNCIATSYVRRFDASGFLGSWSDTGAAHPNWVASRNPAEHYAHVATHPRCLPQRIADARLDFGGLAEWQADCAQIWSHGKPRFMFDRRYEGGSTLARVLDEIAAVGRARRGIAGGRHGVVRDVPQSAPRQHYTPRNSSGYRIEIPFRRRLHGVRVRYNKDGLGQEAEIVVYADGYSADGSVPGTVAATELETAEAIGQTDEELVWALWRYHLAVQQLRPHTHEFSTGVENLRSGRGALVRLTHDVPGFGLAHGRTKAAAVDGGGNFTGVTLDTPVTMEPGKSYGIRLRTHAGSFYTTVNNPATSSPVTTTTLTFSAAQPASWELNAVIDAGTGETEQDIFGFGEADRESAELLVLGVAPGRDLTARLTAVDAAPGVHAADLGPIPAFDPQISLPPADARKPAAPVIRDIKSDESVLLQRVGGALVVRFLAEFNPPLGLPVPDYIQARWRVSEASPWTVGGLQPAASLAYSGEAVQQGQTYRIEFRYVTAAGVPSDWAAREHTIVGKSTRPPDVPGLFHEGEHIRWQYPDAPRDVTYGGGFRVRYHYGSVDATEAWWTSAGRPHDDLVAGTVFPIALLPPGEITILVKAVDADGNESATAARLFTEVAAPAPANIVLARDYAALGFPGIIVNGSVQGGDVVSDSASIFYTPAGVPLWTNPAPVYGDQFATVEYHFVFDVTGDMVPGRLALEHEIDGANRRIDYWAPERGVPFYGADPLYAGIPFYGDGEWRAWPGVLEIAEAGAFNGRIQAGGGTSLGAVRALVASFDVEDVEETLLNVTIAVGGSPAPVTKTYRKFTQVVPVLVDDGGAARGVRIKTALPSDTPPVIECLDAAGATTAGRVNLQPIKGY